MRGRFLSIKKTTILRLSFILSLLVYLTIFVLSFTVLKIENLWFFSFCIFIGIVLVVKSLLFRLDSSCYFGVLLFLIGLFYCYCVYFNIGYLYSVFVILAFAISSFVTFSFFSQPFQFVLSLSLFFVAIMTFIFILNIISLSIFLAFIGFVVILLICSYFFGMKKCKKRNYK